MKRIKVLILAFSAILILSCDTSYRMVTTLEPDGKAFREIYAKADSSFMAGNMAKNPYLFKLGPDWNITRYDTALKYNFFGTEKELNVKISKSASSIDLFSKELCFDKENRSLAAPVERLSKKFRWFFTYFTFRGIYKQLKYNPPIPIEKYVSKNDQILFVQSLVGEQKANALSKKNKRLLDIKERITHWYSRNNFEISLLVLEKIAGEKIAEIDKELIFNELNIDMSPPSIEKYYRILDSYYHTKHYSELYNANKEKMDQEFEKQSDLMKSIAYSISYELMVPGKIIASNSTLIKSNSIRWKVEGIGILLSDYKLIAKYRVTNIWAFFVTGILLLSAIAGLTLFLKRKGTSKGYATNIE